jgi:hypothetical protein
MIEGCVGGHKKSRQIAGAIHIRDICGKLILALTLSWHFLTSGRALDMIDERKKQAAELARQF